MTKNLDVVYRVDENDRIVYANDGWDIFAVENDAKELIRENIKNTNIWKYIQGDEMAHLYSVIFEKVRSNGIELSFHYRCDSPGTRRFLRMKLAPLKEQMIEITNSVVKIEEREPVCIVRNEFAGHRELIRMCSWCKKVEAGDWVEVEVAIRKYGLFQKESLPQITHTICSSCKEKIRDEMRGN